MKRMTLVAIYRALRHIAVSSLAFACNWSMYQPKVPASLIRR